MVYFETLARQAFRIMGAPIRHRTGETSPSQQPIVFETAANPRSTLNGEPWGYRLDELGLTAVDE